LKTLRGKLTYANVISTLCLFLVLGGASAFAATQLAKNSVGAKQLKKGAVTPAKLSVAAKHTLTGAAGKDGARGPEGPRGKDGAQGPGAVAIDVAVPQSGFRETVESLNGVLVGAACTLSGIAELGLAAENNFDTLDAYGTKSVDSGTEVFAVHETATNGFGLSDPSAPHGDNLDVIARDTEVGTAFARFDLHLDSVDCRLRGMITPSGG
jgi:hypothetical protein